MFVGHVYVLHMDKKKEQLIKWIEKNNYISVLIYKWHYVCAFNDQLNRLKQKKVTFFIENMFTWNYFLLEAILMKWLLMNEIALVFIITSIIIIPKCIETISTF